MPVITKQRHKELTDHLHSRLSNLYSMIEARPLQSCTEGCARGSWLYPDKMAATVGSKLELNLAIEDFKAILAELKKL